MDPEKDALEVYKEAGIEFEEAPVEQPIEPEPEPENAEPDSPEADKKPEEEPLQKEPEAPVVQRKRSIYQDLKDKKNEVKTERELREQAERERDELRAKLEAKDNSPLDEIDAFAKEIDADPAVIRRMREVLLKDAEVSNMPADLREQLKQFQEFQTTNSDAVAIVQFDNEFKQAQPSITKMFPNATAEETGLIKEKLNELAHTEQFHDKELEYIAFKNQDVLSNLISPKKRGLEPKRRAEGDESVLTTFNPNADLSTMSAKEAEQWEKEYRKTFENESLAVDSQGRKIFI